MSDVTPAKDLPKIVVRLPEDATHWLRDEARRSASSQNSKVARSDCERVVRHVAARSAGVGPAED